MKLLFLKFLRFGLCIDIYCSTISGNLLFKTDSIKRLAAIDRELDNLEIQHD